MAVIWEETRSRRKPTQPTSIFHQDYLSSLSLSFSPSPSLQMTSPPPDFRFQSQQLVNSCIRSTKQKISSDDTVLVVPTPLLRDKRCRTSPIAASELRIGEVDKPKVHFHQMPLSNIIDTNDFAQSVESFLATSQRSIPDIDKDNILPAILKCEAEIITKLCYLKCGIQNEAELRFAIADPILVLLCSFWNLKVCMYVCGNT